MWDFDELVGILGCQTLRDKGIVWCTKKFMAGIVTLDYSLLPIVKLILSNYITTLVEVYICSPYDAFKESPSVRYYLGRKHLPLAWS